jgi:Cell wall-associated hydrolases (invasion-associated proteins)
MVASLGLPASAATPITKAKTTVPVALAVAVAPPSAAQAPLVPRAFGNIRFRGVDKPNPVPVRTTTVRASRSATRVALSMPAPRSAGVLGIAASLAGIYYVYGGTTTAGFDCSGYTQYVFGKMGISLPRTAEAQRQATTPVSNPQPGDLVFFGSPAHHVGIYAGNGKMWDSPETGSSVGLHSARSTGTFGRV